LEVKIANLSAINILLFLGENSNVLKITLHYYRWLSGFLTLSNVANHPEEEEEEKIKSFFQEIMDTSKFTSTITSTITSTDEKINDMYQCSAKMDQLQNFLKFNTNFKSLDLFRFFLDKIIDYRNYFTRRFPRSIIRLIEDIVSEQEDGNIIKWLVENDYIGVGNYFRHTHVLKPENTEAVCAAINTVTESNSQLGQLGQLDQLWNSDYIRNFFIGKENSTHFDVTAIIHQQLLRCCIKNVNFETLRTPKIATRQRFGNSEKFSLLLKSTNLYLERVAEEISHHIFTQPLVNIILLFL
jgi:hypothetical protein